MRRQQPAGEIAVRRLLAVDLDIEMSGPQRRQPVWPSSMRLPEMVPDVAWVTVRSNALGPGMAIPSPSYSSAVVAWLARPWKSPLTVSLLPSRLACALPSPVMLMRVPSVKGDGDSRVSKFSAPACVASRPDAKHSHAQMPRHPFPARNYCYGRNPSMALPSAQVCATATFFAKARPCETRMSQSWALLGGTSVACGISAGGTH